MERPVRVAIIGTGPAGFYTAGALLGRADCGMSIDMFDRLPAPYGLVRYGVAPDHENIHNVVKSYRKTAAHDSIRFFGNTDYGTDLLHEDLRSLYDMIVYTTGAQSDRRLNIPGEDLKGSYSATAIVAWYNSHPDYRDLEVDLNTETAVVIGVGNVAIDVARILARSTDHLATTDIADHSLDALKESKVREIYVLGRRGPAQAKFTNPEIKAFLNLSEADPIVKPEELELDEASRKKVEQDRTARKNLQTLQEMAEKAPAGKKKRVHFRFCVSPVEIIGDEDGRVKAIKLERNELKPTESGYVQSIGTGEYETIETGLVLRSVGYRGVPLADVPYDKRNGTIPNEKGRIIDPETGKQIEREYVAGWAKRGPTGVIGTNKADAVETVDAMCEDLKDGPRYYADEPHPNKVFEHLEARGCRLVSYEDWRRIEEEEHRRGEAQGRPRVKFVTVEDMLAIVEA